VAGFTWIPNLVKSMAWYSLCTPPLFCISHYFYIFATIVMTLFLILILFIIYFDYMLSIVRLLSCSSISSYSARSKVQGVSGRHYVSMVLIHCIPADASYILGHVVDRGCNTLLTVVIIHHKPSTLCIEMVTNRNLGVITDNFHEFW
jgi:hypothetical protein